MNKQELKNIIGEAKLIVDIGSYNGDDARDLHHLFGCDVHCFEPNEDVFQWSKGLVYHKCAIGSQHGKAHYRTSNHPQSNSIKSPDKHTEVWPDIFFSGGKSVLMCALDDYNFKDIDLMWVDVNGSEGDVIKGAEAKLKHTRYLYIEVSDKELYAGQPKINEIISMLPDFKVIGLYDFGENFGNILFKNMKLC